ncbi:MAG: M16 family metallopeptidase [Planctomycetaceae bacterium]
MPEQIIHTHPLSNGLTVVIEPMFDVQSAAFCFLIPGGSAFDPAGQGGTAAALTDWITRGAGELDSRELSNALDNLGVQRNESTGLNHIAFTGATLGENIPAALALYAEIIRRPQLPDEEFEGAIAGIEQSLRAIEDEPQRKLMIELRRRCYDAPWGLPTEGSLEELPRLTVKSVREHCDRCLRPNGAILGIAGQVDVPRTLELIGQLFGDWGTKPEPSMVTGPRGDRVGHIAHDSTQMHIGIGYDAIEYSHPDYYKAWAAVGVLSGGMSSRLFTEVRERRGLCYSVSASLNSLLHEGRVLTYAGTTVERAQETFDVTLRELQRLGDGIELHELERCKARAKSSLIMQQESTTSRATSIARDWHFLKRIQTLDDIRRDIDSLTVAGVLDYVHQHPARDFTVLTIGPNPLNVTV